MSNRRTPTDDGVPFDRPWEGGPVIMGILNSSPESFYAEGIQDAIDEAVEEAERMVADGADIIDIGGESNSPGADPIDADEEIRRLVPYVEELAELDVPISVDTWKAEVAEATLDAGADIINDVSGLEDPEMASVVVKYDVPIVLMHSVSIIVDEDREIAYDDVVGDVANDLSDLIESAQEAGIPSEHIVIDPGISFGKRHDASVELVARLDELRDLGYPVLVGHSRKIAFRIEDATPKDCLPATLALTTAAVERGAGVVRVHDVPENVEAVAAAEELDEYSSGAE